MATETTTAPKAAKVELPPVINLEGMKADFGEKGEAAFHAIGIAGGFGDFRQTQHPGPTFDLSSLTGEHKAAVEKIWAGLGK